MVSSDHRFIELGDRYLGDLVPNMQRMVALTDGMYISHGFTEGLALQAFEASSFAVLLRGHVDAGRKAEFEQQGGQELVRSMSLKAMELSRQRAQAVRDALLERYPKIDAKRIELVGRGWEEPAGTDSDLNRRVEVQWFTLE